MTDGSVDTLVLEEPLMMICGGSRVLTMRTPGAEAELAVGFLASEGYIAGADEVESVTFEPVEGCARGEVTDTVRVALKQGELPALAARLTRTHEIRPSCGVCGLQDASELLTGVRPLVVSEPKVSPEAVQAMVAELSKRQLLFHATGACHGAALFDAGGALLALGEDVGRHNALDKAIGRALLDRRDLSRTIAVLSGRAGYELIIKLLRVGCPVIASISAPSALSFDLCREAGATLIGFVRGDRMKVYWAGDRLATPVTRL